MEGEGAAKDLAEKVGKGEITSDEARRELRKRGLGHEETWKDAIWYIVWSILCFLPAIAKALGIEVLGFLAQIPTIEFPAIVIHLSIALFIAAIPLMVWFTYFNFKKGGCRSEDHTVVLLKSGPYGIVRHPGCLAGTVFFVTIPVILSEVIPFTILSAIATVEIIVVHYYGCVEEERKLNIPKWGDEYRQYMKEVPRLNLILGIWRWARRKRADANG